MGAWVRRCVQAIRTLALAELVAVAGGCSTHSAAAPAASVTASEPEPVPAWTWMGGSQEVDASGTFGTRGVASVANTPAARSSATSWSDAQGNLWLFGGMARGTSYGDLWRYSIMHKTWEWVAGDPTGNEGSVHGLRGVADRHNEPGARFGSMAWLDRSGVFWVFGGVSGWDGSHSRYLNDLWSFDPHTGLWAWMGGSPEASAPGVYGTQGKEDAANWPGSRYGAVTWRDAKGQFWLFGGSGYGAIANTSDYLSDLWMFNPATHHWTWMGGTTGLNKGGTYGSVGLPSPENMPGARIGAVAWTDKHDHLWLFGGYGYDAAGRLNILADMWRYDVAARQWTWIDGTSAVPPKVTQVWIGQTSVESVLLYGTYGRRGVAAATNKLGARAYGVGWTDAVGNVWLFGGSLSPSGIFNDLWRYEPSTGQWTWMNGKNYIHTTGVYGHEGVAAAANTPGAREGAASWTDAGGNLWLFGGNGLGAPGAPGTLNDLWRFHP